MNKYKYLLFDLDGTLFDINAVEIFVLKEVLTNHSLRYDDMIFKEYSKINEELWKKFEIGKMTKSEVRFKRFEILIRKFYKQTDVNIKELSDSYFNLFSKTVIAYDGTANTLETLKNKYELYVISNGSTDVQYYKLDKLDFTKYFKKIFLSEEIGYAKPNPLFFDYVYNSLNRPAKENVLVIGDSISADIVGGFNYGFDTCYVGLNKCNIATMSITNINQLVNLK